MNTLKALRSKWGGDRFDTQWKKTTGEDVPDLLKDIADDTGGTNAQAKS
ncbi:MAG: hypothetical protein ACREDR_28935 [Blastocatellia bacterium]